MKKITDLKPQIKSPTRVSVFLDNVFYCGLELETAMRKRLKIGDEIDEETLDEIQFDSERSRAMDKALGFITRTRKTEKQVADYLASKGYTEKTINSVLEAIKGYGFVSDGDYAEEYVKQTSGRKGKRLIARELKAKGVSDENIRDALSEVGDETASAVAVARKYLRSKPKDKANLFKCYKYLLSKGFDYDAAKAAAESFGSVGEDD